MSTYTIYPAQNICGEGELCGETPVTDPYCALTCTDIGNVRKGGFPRAGGRIQFTFHSDVCPPSTTPSMNICFQNSLFLQMCSARPNKYQECSSTQWITKYTYFASRTSQQGTAAQFRASAIITVPSQTELNVNLKIDFLNQEDGQNSWNPYINVSNILKLQGPYGKLIGLAYKSDPEYIPVSPFGEGPNCEVKYISMIAGIEPLFYGCVPESGATQVCSMWNGDTSVTCFRGLLINKSGTQLPKPFLCAMNPSTCGGVGGGFCGCDRCELTSPTSFRCQYNTDPSFIAYLDTVSGETVGAQQQIQLAADTSPLNIMIKSIDGANIKFYWRNPSVSVVWSVSSGVIVDGPSPTVWMVEDETWQIFFYAMIYPNEDIVPKCPEVAQISPIEAVYAETAPTLTRSERLATRVNSGCGCKKN